MVRQIAPFFQEPSRTMLEERVHVLEIKVAALTKAVQVLARELAAGPPDGPAATPGGTAGRRARSKAAADGEERSR